jgi:hypothetical protein
MTANDYQRVTAVALRRHFIEVSVEWSVVRNAQDALARDVGRYAPRVDIAVGPFNTTPNRDPAIRAVPLPRPLRAAVAGLERNQNPRCLLAIEVVFSGSSKHIMGDILNASALGLYGVVIGKEELMPKIRRISAYINVLAHLDKMPPLFGNVLVLSTTDFDELLA